MMVAAAERALTSYHWLGIPIAVAGAVLLALGTMFQHRGVENEGPAQGRGPGSMGGGRLQALLRKPVWLAGTVMLGAAILLQLTSLRFSPLIVVQPIGAVALVVTTLATVWATRTSPGPRVITSVALCVTGVAAFVTVAAVSAQDVQISDRHLVTILILLGTKGPASVSQEAPRYPNDDPAPEDGGGQFLAFVLLVFRPNMALRVPFHLYVSELILRRHFGIVVLMKDRRACVAPVGRPEHGPEMVRRVHEFVDEPRLTHHSRTPPVNVTQI
ncbi:hypothetical protein KIH31_09675 [Paenarthrobacter sp. DKR-5]|uniref:hypothetical protein n=1 Tax=Paenarthrobacter sp. DKR-5 TaxID=2835535 RepID=UPI001BDBC67D|nr:hypothetical protein [Paenarthrobacter sp. DKR-5]MBT1002874.1 hypothetical protein [Paenarthrobacter sp. DKR-5]